MGASLALRNCLILFFCASVSAGGRFDGGGRGGGGGGVVTIRNEWRHSALIGSHGEPSNKFLPLGGPQTADSQPFSRGQIQTETLPTAFLESATRYSGLFYVDPPSVIAQFVERVPMVKGRHDPEASTATAYAWLIWFKDREPPRADMVTSVFQWIPPCRSKLQKSTDA